MSQNSKSHELTEEQQSQLDRLLTLSDDVFNALQQFRTDNPDVSEDMIMRNLCYDIGAWIALAHEHWFRNNRHRSLKFYQEVMKQGMEAGVKTWGKGR